jgi:hypothetical protein
MSTRDTIVTKLNTLKQFMQTYDQKTDKLLKLKKELTKVDDDHRPQVQKAIRNCLTEYHGELAKFIDSIEEQYLAFTDEWYIKAYLNIQKSLDLEAELKNMGFKCLVDIDSDKVTVYFGSFLHICDLSFNGTTFIELNEEDKKINICQCDPEVDATVLYTANADLVNLILKYQSPINVHKCLQDIYGKYKDAINEIMEINNELFVEQIHCL